MLTVVKATERDGVTPKDGDVGELLERTNITKRFGLKTLVPTNSDELSRVSALLLESEDGKRIYTSSILDVVVDEEGLFKVVTRNTIYFLQES